MTEERRQRNAKRWAAICNEHENGCFCPMQTFEYCPFGTVGKACSTITPEDWEHWLEGKRMSEDEKRGFRNGCRYMLNMISMTGAGLKARGEAQLGNFVMFIIDAARDEISTATDFYSVLGEKMFDNKEDDKKRSSLTANAPTATARAAKNAMEPG